MAIIRGLPGLEVTIFTNGRTAKEYDDPSKADNQDSRVATKYIECKHNESFRIHLRATDEYSWGFKNHILNFAGVIDGIWAKGEICRQEDTKEEEWERDISYRVVKSPDNSARYVIQEFAFSSIIKTDDATDEQQESDVEKMERLGTIEVRVNRAKVEGNGPVSVPCGDHLKDFIISREALRGKAKSHGIKYTRTQPAVKPKYMRCSTLTEDDGPIAIFRFKYRSREALKLEGVMPDPQQPFDWLVEIPDDEEDGDKRRNSGGNRQNPLGKSDKAETKIKEEEEDDGADIVSFPASSTAGQNNSKKLSEPPELKHPVPYEIKHTRPKTQNQARIHGSSGVWNIDSTVRDRYCRLIRTGFTPSQARSVVASRHSAPRSVVNTSSHLRNRIESESRVKQEVGRSAHGISSAKRASGKTGLQDMSIDDDNDVALVRETMTSPGLRSRDIVLSSIETSPDISKANTEPKKQTTSKRDKSITQRTGVTTAIDGENQSTTLRTVNVAKTNRHRLDTSGSATQSLNTFPKAKDEYQSSNNLSKEEREHRAQKLRTLKARHGQYQVRRDGPPSLAAPNPFSSLPHPARVVSATNLLKTLLFPQSTSPSTNSPVAPTANHASPTLPPSGFPPPLGVTLPGPATVKKPRPNSTSKTSINSRTDNPSISTGAAATATRTTKGKKAASKRKAIETDDIPSGRPPYGPHPPKMPKTRD
ncbi:hypothetical protein F4859DRAFT_522296 [Xylaria cf. heliscus]|nr:hypothetical protein F4859DRAFT_522296 [Xylaria cf. heliscus]